MPGPARVDSIQALREFRQALIAFADEARSALDSAQSELNRSSAKLSHELPAHWAAERRRWEEEIVRARIALENATSQAKMGKSTIDERKALARARQNAAGSRDKLEASKKWSREIERERTLYRGQVEPLARVIEGGVAKAVLRLDRMGEDLEGYTRVQAPEDRHSAAEVERTIAGAVSHASGGSADLYHTLRALLPHRETLLDAERTDTPPEGITLALSRDERQAIALASGAFPAIDLRLDIAIALDAAPDMLVLQREEPVDERDSGWRLHPGAGGSTWTRVPCVKLLGVAPDLAGVSRFPPGWALLADASGVRTLFDTIGEDVWETVRSPEPRTGGADP
ncbi:MAG: hypothetical protein AAGH64_03800 [Planctomycetota bacterium]